MRILIPAGNYLMSKFTHINIYSYNFRKRLKTLLLIVIFGASTCYCLTFIQVDYNIIGNLPKDISWFRAHRNISVFLQINENTFKVAPGDVKKWSNYLKNASVVYFVASSPGNRIARHVVRNTWGSTVQPRPIFLTGYVDNTTEMNLLNDEAKLYNDIIIENFLDTYKNLTLKTAFIFKHFLRLFPTIPYFMKTDDDVLVNPNKITKILEDILQKKTGIYLPMIGKLYPSNIPHRNPNSKWYLPFWMYRRRYLPAYLSGTGYLVPGSSARKILKTSIHVPMLPLEDVYFVGLVANEASRIPLMGRNDFVDIKPIFTDYCYYKNLATVHHLEPIELSTAWTNLYRERDVCNGVLKKVYKFIFD